MASTLTAQLLVGISSASLHILPIIVFCVKFDSRDYVLELLINFSKGEIYAVL